MRRTILYTVIHFPHLEIMYSMANPPSFPSFQCLEVHLKHFT